MLDLNILEETRRGICRNCEHYNKIKDSCSFLTLKTGKAGSLSHHDGVRNPKARCPFFTERKWNFIPSYWAFSIHYSLMPLTPHEVYEYTKANYLSPFAIMDRLYDKEERDGIKVPLRSQIVTTIKELNSTKNDYRHVKYLTVDYVNGELSERSQNEEKNF
jgi:hypothetical protein